MSPNTTVPPFTISSNLPESSAPAASPLAPVLAKLAQGRAPKTEGAFGKTTRRKHVYHDWRDCRKSVLDSKGKARRAREAAERRKDKAAARAAQ